MCAKAYARLWILRKLDPLGVSQSQLLDVYEKQVMVKYASLVWTGALTRNEIVQIERVQKAAFAMILGSQYVSNSHALEVLVRPTLESRRLHINLRFARKCRDSEKFSHWFTSLPKNTTTVNTRSKKKELELHLFCTEHKHLQNHQLLT